MDRKKIAIIFVFLCHSMIFKTSFTAEIEEESDDAVIEVEDSDDNEDCGCSGTNRQEGESNLPQGNSENSPIPDHEVRITSICFILSLKYISLTLC